MKIGIQQIIRSSQEHVIAHIVSIWISDLIEKVSANFKFQISVDSFFAI
jgi:hypothetical protein